MAALLWVLVLPALKRSATPIVRSKTQHCRTKLACSFESSWREKTDPWYSQYSLAKFRKIKTKSRMLIVLSVNIIHRKKPKSSISISIGCKVFWVIYSLFVPSSAFELAYNELCTAILNFWPQWWGSLTFCGDPGYRISMLSCHFGRRVSDMAGNLLFALPVSVSFCIFLYLPVYAMGLC